MLRRTATLLPMVVRLRSPGVILRSFIKSRTRTGVDCFEFGRELALPLGAFGQGRPAMGFPTGRQSVRR
jgi:hypothetical protein